MLDQAQRSDAAPGLVYNDAGKQLSFDTGKRRRGIGPGDWRRQAGQECLLETDLVDFLQGFIVSQPLFSLFFAFFDASVSLFLFLDPLLLIQRNGFVGLLFFVQLDVLANEIKLFVRSNPLF